MDQLLHTCIPKLDNGMGNATAEAVYGASEQWGISEKVKAMCFDTTASNTGLCKGACILLEQKMDRDLLWFPCRQHVLEIMLEAVVTTVFLK